MTHMIQTQRLLGKRASRFSLGHLLAVAHQRRALSRLDDAALADIGLTRREAAVEARRAFWDIDL